MVNESPRMGRPPGGAPPRIDWKDPEQRRKYKAAAARDYAARKLALQAAEGKKVCYGPLCNGAVRSLGEFDPKPGTKAGVVSRCRRCKDFARKARYDANPVPARVRARASAAAIRDKAIQVYGGQCERCGNTHDLEFDHVNGDGGEHRKVEDASTMKRRIAVSGRRLDDRELRLLCRDCHRGQGASWTRRALRLKIASSNDWPVVL